MNCVIFYSGHRAASELIHYVKYISSAPDTAYTSRRKWLAIKDIRDWIVGWPDNKKQPVPMTRPGVRENRNSARNQNADNKRELVHVVRGDENVPAGVEATLTGQGGSIGRQDGRGTLRCLVVLPPRRRQLVCGY